MTPARRAASTSGPSSRASGPAGEPPRDRPTAQACVEAILRGRVHPDHHDPTGSDNGARRRYPVLRMQMGLSWPRRRKPTPLAKPRPRPKGADPAQGRSGRPRRSRRRAGPPRQPGVERRKNHPSRAKHGYIHLILTQAIPQLGQSGDLVKVRPGFARNYLVPQGLATFATQNNLRMVEKHRQRSERSRGGAPSRPPEPGRSDRPALADDRSQRQRRGTSLRLGQRRSDRRGAAARGLPDPGRRTSGSKGRSRSWASTRSRSSWLRTSRARSSSGSCRPTPTKRPG